MTDSPIVSGMFHAVPLPHQSGLRPASFPRGEALVPGFRALGIFGNGSVLSRSGTAHRPFPTYFNGRIQMNNVGRSNNCQLFIVHCQFFPPFRTYFNGWVKMNDVGLPNNCQLSTVNCQLKRIVHSQCPLPADFGKQNRPRQLVLAVGGVFYRLYQRISLASRWSWKLSRSV